MPNPVSPATLIAFVALTLALACVWLPRLLRWPPARYAWAVPAAAALIAALAAALVDWRGVVALLLFAAICLGSRRTNSATLTVCAHVTVLAMSAALFLHVVPGFFNPRIVTNAILAADSEPYTKYLNFDKGAAALCLLALYVPERAGRDEGMQHLEAFAWRFAVLVTVVMIASIAVGYVRWDPKLPSWWAMWLWSMVFFTALPEETLFRGVAQTAIERWMRESRHRTTTAAIVAGVVFGVAHSGGGLASVLLASIAGIGYGWIYGSTRSLSLAAAAHTGLNTLHFLFFSYPALRLPGGP